MHGRHAATALLLVALIAFAARSAEAVCGNNVVEPGEQCDNTAAGGCCLNTCLSALNNTVTNPSATFGSYTLPYALTTSLASIGLTTAGANYPVSWSIASTGAGSTTYDPGVTFTISGNTNLNWNRVYVGTFNVTFQTVYCTSPFRALYFYRQLTLNQFESCTCVGGDVVHPWCIANPTRADETQCDCFTRQCYRRDSSNPVMCSPIKCRAGYNCASACNDLLVSKPRSFSILGNDCTSTSNQCTQTANLACTCNAVCGDLVLDSGEECDAGSPAPYGSCCTHNCTTTPLNPSPTTGTYTLPTCTNSVLMATLGLVTTGSNYVVVFEVASVTNVSALSATITGAGTTLQFNRTYGGVAVVTFRALFCNATSQYVTFTRTITATGCCGNNIVEYGEICDVGATSGQAGSCCTTDCRPLRFDGGQTYTPVCKGNKRMYTMDEIGLGDANIQVSAMTITRNQTWYQGAGETNREFYTDWSQASIFTNVSATYLRFVAGIIGGVNLTFSYNYCNSPATTLDIWKTLWIPRCVCSYCSEVAGFGPYCSYFTSSSNPLVSTNPSYKCDCSKVTCFQRNTASLSYGELVCPTVKTGAGCFTDGYAACHQACDDVFSPKPVTFSVQYTQTDENDLPCPIGVSSCAGDAGNQAQYWLNCSCPAECGDGVVDQNEFCDTGAGGGTGVSSCCTTNCLAPTTTSPATFSFTTSSCVASVSLSSIQIATTGGNFVPSWSVANYSGVTGLTPSISSGNLLFGDFFTGTVVFTLRSRWCNSPNQYIYVTRTITNNCCDNSVIDPGEECDLGGSGNGGASTCCSNNCQFRPTSRQCRASASACDAPEFCTGVSDACPTNVVYNNTIVCRPAAGTCDVEEKCNGVSSTCPTDLFFNSSTLCRNVTGFCDVAEFCSGSSATCPANVFKSSSTVCRNATDVCDVEERCTGSSDTCPVDGFANSSAVCRPAATICDVQETCTGLGPACPTDLFASNTKACRNATDVCDITEYCTGASSTCPANTFVTAGTVCRPAAGDCDTAETCTGSGASCPVDALVANGTQCRAAAGVCDVPEQCNGVSVSCPADALVANGVECRPSAGDCDIAEACTGVDVNCPVDVLRPNGFTCRVAVDLCDVSESCTGVDATCPVDLYQTAGTACRASSGVCDPQDLCDGATTNCPDVLYNATVVCRAPQGACDAPEYCTGVDGNCPIDVLYPNTQVCRNATGPCDAPENCTGTSSACPVDVLRPNTYYCAFESGGCSANTTCTGISSTCPASTAPAGTPCTVDGNLCYLDTCAANGTCLRGSALNYDDALYCNGLETCDPLTGGIVFGTPPLCDDGNSCTSNTCSNLLAACVYTPLPGTFGPCGGGLGACTPGNYSCNGTGPSPVVTCVGEVLPTPEVCGDGIDNNCNGIVDGICSGQGCVTDADCANITLGTCSQVSCGSNLICNVTFKPVDAPCDDRMGCTYDDKCTALGVCVGTPIVCNDFEDCTYDYCAEPYGRCVFDAEPLVGSDCPLGHCSSSGQCEYPHVTCPVLNASVCSRYVFNRDTGVCDLIARTGSCDDGNECTVYDACVDGACVGAPKVCDDFVECTIDSCIAPLGICQHTVNTGHCYIDGYCMDDGDVNPKCDCLVCNSSISTTQWSLPSTPLSCNDGDTCTENDVCNVVSGVCEGTPISCTSPGQCYQSACAGGQCTVSPVTVGTPCDDGDACTENDVCANGQCVGSLIDCGNFSSECVAPVCDPLLGCASVPVVDYTRCNLHMSECAGVHYCLAGSCVNSGPLVCPVSSNPCTEYVCVPDSGCVQRPLVGQACDDNNTCTSGDYCSTDGTCVPGGIWLNCDDLDDCTDDFCLADGGCLHIPILNCDLCNATSDCSLQTCQQVNCVRGRCRYVADPAGFSCSDGDVCNGNEVCTGNGVCVSLGPFGCDDFNQCTIDTCNSSGCSHAPNYPSSCDDGSVCTTGDACTVDGQCIGTPFACPDDTHCLRYECVDVSGTPTCIATPVNEGSYCSTGDPCLNNGVCDRNGACLEEEFVCPTPNECVESYTCYNATCVPVGKPAGTPCNQDNLCDVYECNGIDFCNYVTAAVTCVPQSDCEVDRVCIPASGECAPIYAEDGTTCDDGNLCTGSSSCLAGVCIGADPELCFVADSCHQQGVCDPLTGTCAYAASADYTPCLSVNATDLTTNSICLNGTCVESDPVVCYASLDPCKQARFDPKLGCVEDFVADGTACDDDDVCTSGTTCQSGQCVGGENYNCSYDTLCEHTYCLSYSGCISLGIDDCRPCAADKDCPYIPCKRGRCDAGTCAYSDDDTALSGCDDSQYCNGREFCFAGTCHVKPPPDCDDNNDCTIDTCDFDLQQCRHVPTGNTSCENGDLCAIESRCDGQGHCLTISSLPCDEGRPCRESLGCNPKTGACEYKFDKDGAACEIPGDLCAQKAECRLGVCHIVKNVTCASECTCDQSAVCDALTGLCVVPDVCNRDLCSDGNSCTLGDRCEGSVCVPGPFTVCDYAFHDEQCQVSSCMDGECFNENLADGTPCTTNIPRGPCSADDVCLNGACVRHYKKGTVCREAGVGGCDTAEYCSGWGDNCPDDDYLPDGTPCPDLLFCYSSTCSAGQCVPTVARDCSDLDDACTVGVCDEESKRCLAKSKPEHTPCISGIESQCVPFSACKSGVCAPQYANELTPCDDGTLCSSNDHCSGYNANCVAGESVSCSHLDGGCSLGACNPLTGACIKISINEGQSCNADNNPCTANDTCQGGYCLPGDALDCSYLNSSCQYGQCSVVGGSTAVCTPVYVDRACDPDYCTGGCTVPFVWWSLHNSRCRNPAQQFDWPSGLEESVMCDQSYYYWSQKRATTLWRALMHEWLAATLNYANGACLPNTVIDVYADVEQLLRQCDLDVSNVNASAGLYKSYAIMLKTYNSGIFGPGECTQAPCATPLYESDYFACLFQTRDNAIRAQPVDFFSADTCENGAWDYVSESCQCFVGWAGLDCTECDSGVNDGETYVCVPLRYSREYTLRSVPTEELGYYLDEEQLLEFVRITGRKGRIPGDGVLDCECRRVEENAVSARDFNVYIAQDNTLTFIGAIEENLRLCEQTFDVTVINANPDCVNESIGVVVPGNDTSCGVPADWSYICDCCGPDDDGCVCPHNDVMCLRQHVLDEHQRLWVYQRLFVVFMVLAGILFIYTVMRATQSRRAARKEKKKDARPTEQAPVRQRLTWRRKGRK